MYSGTASGRVLDGELLYTNILEVNLFAFAYRLFHRDFSPLNGTFCIGRHSFFQLYMYFILIWEGFYEWVVLIFLVCFFFFFFFFFFFSLDIPDNR